MRQGHKTLENMLDVAENRGISIRGNWKVEYIREERVKLDMKQDIKRATYRIYHWNTLVLEVEEHQKAIGWVTTYHTTYVYGQSVSDARAINAALHYFGIGGKRYTYKPVNGGFQEQQ